MCSALHFDMCARALARLVVPGRRGVGSEADCPVTAALECYVGSV